MGEVSFGHKGRATSSVKFPYTPKGLNAMGHAEKIVKSMAKKAKGMRGAKSGLTVGNSGHRSAFSDYSLGRKGGLR